MCWIFARVADKTEEKNYVWLIVLLLTLMSGLRHPLVGWDTANYIEKFTYIANKQFQYAYGLENSFKWICYVFLKVIPNVSALLTTLAFITNFFVVIRLWELRKVATFSTMVACFYMGFFFMSLNVMRQFCAMGIVFYATRYLVKHQSVRFVVGVLIASLFHRSAIICLGLVAFDILRWRELRGRYKLFLLGVVACSPVLLAWVLKRMSYYDKYLALSDVDFGLIVPAKIAFFSFAVLFVFWIYGKNHHFPDWQAVKMEEKNAVFLSCICYAVGLCLMFASYFIVMMNRLGWYFSIFECVFMGMLTKTDNRFHRLFFTVCTWALVGFGFLMAMIGNQQGTMPYLFVWQ